MTSYNTHVGIMSFLDTDFNECKGMQVILFSYFTANVKLANINSI